jgi:hypothetical protein
MSLAGTKPQSLTVVSGGINRLRTKGGASRSALFDAENVYVTASNTIVPRPGTDRNADISEYSGAGATVGLVGYQGALHTFSAQVVDVPPGYVLHVLGHPQSSQVTTSNGNVTFAVHADTSASFVFDGIWENTGIGYANTLSPDGACGSLVTAPPYIDGALQMLGVGLVTIGGIKYVMLVAQPGTPQNFFFQLELTLQGGSQNIYTEASATYSLRNANGSTGSGTYPTWLWAAGSNVDFENSVETSVTLTGLTDILGSEIVPIKEIHYASPFFGGLYVVAEFDTTSAVESSAGSVFHYWIQSSTEGDNSNEWAANTDVQIGQVMIPTVPNGLTYVAARRFNANPLWTPDTAEVLNNVVEPNIANGKKYTVTAVQGSNPATGDTEPTWPTVDGSTVEEQSILNNDASFTTAAAAPATPTSPTPTKYQPTMA